MQTEFFKEGISRGDCLRACIASLTGIPFEQIHHSVQMEDYLGLILNNGFDINCTDRIEKVESNGIDGYFIGVGPTPRGPYHAVIINKNGDLVHDPHPSGVGISKLVYIYEIEKILQKL